MPNGCVNTYPFKCAEGFMPSSTLSWRVYIRSVQVSSCLRLQGCGRPGCYEQSKMPTLYLLNLLTSQYRASLIQKYCNMSKIVVCNGGTKYRLSDREEGRIERFSPNEDKWCTDCICSAAKELLVHNGCLAYKNANGELFVETATGWHKVVEEKSGKKSSWWPF